MQRRSDAELAGADRASSGAACGRRRGSRRPPPRGVRHRPRGRQAGRSASATSTCRSWAAPALHFGWVAEMKTGEGKTLVATLPAYLNALAGRGVHLVTVNDYLAKRDAEWMGQLYRFLGLEVGMVAPRRSTTRARSARRTPPTSPTAPTTSSASTTSATTWPDRSGEQAAARPLLRDRRRGRLDPHRRGPHAAHHLGPGRRRAGALLPVRAHREGPPARPRLRGRRGEAHGRARPRRASHRVEQALGVDNLYEHVNQNFVHQLQAALRAKELFKRDVDYVVQTAR